MAFKPKKPKMEELEKELSELTPNLPKELLETPLVLTDEQNGQIVRPLYQEEINDKLGTDQNEDEPHPLNNIDALDKIAEAQDNLAKLGRQILLDTHAELSVSDNMQIRVKPLNETDDLKPGNGNVILDKAYPRRDDNIIFSCKNENVEIILKSNSITVPNKIKELLGIQLLKVVNRILK